LTRYGCQMFLVENESSGDGEYMFVFDRYVLKGRDKKLIRETGSESHANKTTLKETCAPPRLIRKQGRALMCFGNTKASREACGKSSSIKKYRIQIPFLFLTVLVFVGCGPRSEPPRLKEYTLSGYVHLGNPVSGAEVKAYSFTGLTRGRLLASAKTDSTGAFKMVHSVSHQGPVLLTASNGSFKDIATDLLMELPENELIRSINPDPSKSENVNLTALTSLAPSYIAALAAAKKGESPDDLLRKGISALTKHFYDSDSPDWLISTKPLNEQSQLLGPAERDVRNHLIHAGLSFLARQISVDNHLQAGTIRIFNLIEALSRDLDDQIFDGKKSGAPLYLDKARQIELHPEAVRNHLASAINTYLLSVDRVNESRFSVDKNALFAPGGFLTSLVSGNDGILFSSPGHLEAPGIYPALEQPKYVQQHGGSSRTVEVVDVPKTTENGVDWKQTPKFYRLVNELDNVEGAPKYRINTKSLYGATELRYVHGPKCPDNIKEALGKIPLNGDEFDIPILGHTSTFPMYHSEMVDQPHCLKIWAVSSDEKVIAEHEVKFYFETVSPPIEFEFNPAIYDAKKKDHSGNSVAVAMLYNPHNFHISAKASINGVASYEVESKEDIVLAEETGSAREGRLANPFFEENFFREDGGDPIKHRLGWSLEELSQPRYTQICRLGQIAVVSTTQVFKGRYHQRAQTVCESPHGKYGTLTTYRPRVVDSSRDLFVGKASSFEVRYFTYWKVNGGLGDEVVPDNSGLANIPPYGAVLAIWYDKSQDLTKLRKTKESEEDCKLLISAQDPKKPLCRDAKCRLNNACWHTSAIYAQLNNLDNTKNTALISFTTTLDSTRTEYKGTNEKGLAWKAKEYR
jgi:hypothetical protein